MAQRENRLEANMDTRIAVIGMSAILPCGTTVRESWEAIRDGIDCLSDLPEDRVDVTAYFDPVKTTKDKIYCKRGGFIPEYDFDAREFGLNMFQMEDSDANQTVTLLKVKEALEDAGIEALSKEKKNIGCVLGIGGGQKSSHEFYSRLNYVVVEKVLRKMGMPEEDVQAAVEKYKANFPEWRLDSFPGFLGNVTAGRCTNTFNLDGMNCVVDAACASSLIAVKVAIDELLHGDCDMMITGATCTDNSIGMYMAFSKTPVFSTDPSVRAYDEKTKGMLIGEGSAMLVLKRYADAVRDGDEIHAVIRGCASSSDGKASGIYTSTISGQEEALRRAYMRANVDPATVTLVEGHGTGTPVGDRIELTALRNLFDSAYGNEKEKVAVGSIKSNIGHLKAVAGLAGMIKVIMALKHKTLPATINVDEPPKLYDNTPITDSSLYINTMNRPWFPAPGVPRRAGISSFGFGGANYHAVLEEAEPEHQKAYCLNKRPQPVLLMASSTQALASLCEAQLKEFEKAIEENKTVKNTAYIKCVDFCEKFKFPGSIPSSNARLGFLVKEADDATETLRAIVAQFQKSAGKDSWHLPRQGVSFRAQGINTTGGVAALFSGQGAQYTHMFSEVAMNWPQFRESISDMDRAQAKVAGADKDYERVSQVLYPRKPYNSEPEQDHKKISLTSYSQPSTLACALGAYEIFKQAGFKPDFAAGHSLGEFAALYAADCVNRDDLFELVCRRARIMGGKDAPATPKGCMAAVIGPNAEKIQIRTADVWLGNCNSMAAVIGPNAEKIQIRTADVWLGNCNSPSQTVITGSVEGIKKESELLQSEGFRVVPLACESAFHSPQMQNASSAFKDVLSKVAFRQPSAQTKLFSNVSGETYSNNAQDLLKEHMTSSVKFISQVRNMHSAGARIFVEFGPKQVLSKLVSETLKDDPSIITISVNPSSGKDADIQLREAAVQLVVAGVNLQGFDKWDAPDATRLQPIKKKKTTLRLSAATYVSDKTKKAREAAMNDGRMLSCVSKVIAPPDAKPIVDTKAQEEVARLQKQLQDAQAQIQKAKADAAEADKKLAAAKDEAKRAAASAPVQKQVDTTIVDKHRAILKSMLAELDCYSTPGAVSSSFQAPVAATPAPVAAPVAAAPAPAVNNALLAKAESVVMEVLAAKTGYETDMIEPDMELETELGIDSIKRVEILSEVQAQLNVEAKDVDALSRTRTVGEVVNAMKAEIAGSSGAAAAAPAPVAAAPAAPAPAVNSALLAKAETVVMEVLAAKTGYETDMIEPDMELETELGIDSIKRVEILSEVQAQLNVEAKDVDALSRTRTVGEVVNAMKAEIAGSSGAAAPAPVAAAPAPVAAAAPAVNSALLEKAETVVMEVLAAKTGYETDMIEPDMELETELGIDSIKRVEILSEVQAQLNVEAKDVDALSRTRTVGEVVNAMKAEIAGSSGAAAPAPVAAAPAPVAAAAPAVNSALLEKAETVVMEVLAAKTGYETDMIEPDMELETELGIDSIKRVEILSEVQAQLNVEAKDVDALSRTRTVGEVVNAMKAEIAGSSGAAAAAPAPVAAAPAAPAPAVNSALLAKAETVVMEVLAAKTGYETDMIEPDMELETELGIDSIKRVEILSEVQAQLNVEAKDVDALSRTRTVGEVVNAMKAEIAGSSGAAAPAPVAAAPAPVAAAAPAVNSALLEKAETVVMEVLAAKTGYETDMIEPDMELETELGIDSIKRVEILSEVQAQLNVEAKDVDALSRTRTVGEVVNAMKAEIAGSSGAAAAAPAPVAAAPAAPAPAVNSALLAKAETVVMEVLAAKTGYETDMIEPDMELETELGIDSIKRVEILSEVQAQLNVEAKDVDALSRTRTVGEVVNAMKAEIAGSSGAAAPAPVAAAPAPVAAAAPAVNSALLEKAETVVMEVLAAKTGYETDMIEPDMELETELGIDSIKRVEILSEVQAQLNVEAKDVDALSRTRTVGEVVNAMKAEIAGSSGAAAPAPVAAAPAPVAAAAPAVNSALLEKAETVVMEVLAAKTGYETDMIEPDMELETELGIDSIKRVEILSEVQAQLNVEAKDVDALSRTRTVGEVVNAMKAEIAGSSGAAAAAPAPVAAAPAAPAPAVNSALLAKAETVVMEVLAAKTGYETDMIEPDMELETELGIDSIKRVEILSEVQAQLNVEAKDVDALSRTRTVGEVVNAMKAEIAGSSGAAAPAPVAAAPAPVAAAAPAVNSALLEKAETVVMEVLAAKTGYETDMIEPDMELETELGIDSIKRVEILSEVQAQLNVEAKDVDALSRTRTVGEVVNAMKAEIAGSSGAAAAAPAPVAAAPAAPAPAVNSALLAKAETVVMEVLAAKTGYETDMIEPDMELETELGIDSIKRVEILSEVQAMLNVEAKDVDALSRTRTVGEVVNAMKAEIASSSGAAAPAPAAAAAPAPAAAPAVSSALLEKAESVVMEVLAAKTGYETDMIEADMELETELGIDSIKRVEILSEVQAMLNVEAKDVDALSRTRTVGEVVNAMKAEIAGSSGAATASAPAAAAAAPAIKISTVHGADCDDLSVMSAELVDIRRADELLLERPENRPVLIVDDGTELTSALVRVLGAGAVVLTFDGLQLAQRAGAAVRHVQVKDLSAESAEKAIKEAEQRFGQLGGFISQQAERFAPADILGFTLMCAKFANASLCTPVQGGRAFFIGVARLDGRLGFTSQGSTDSLTRAQRGAIFGLCKTIGLEWSANEVFARGIDIAREVHPEDAAVAITREMSCADNRIREVGIGLNQKRCTIRAVDLKPGAPKIQISQDDVLPVSGGARGITPLCIREITRQVRGGKYILLGRSKVPAGEPAWCNGVSDDDLGKAAMQELKRAFSAGEGPKPTPMTHKKLVGTIAGAREVRSSIANIEALGGKAIYSSCDVNSAADVAKAVREAEAQLGARVTGVVHASGVLRDRLIEQKRPDEFDAVFGTKVTGLENLFGAIDMANLKHLVLFSSLAGFHGNIGQSDYAMANEALNKMGLELSDRVSVKSICFGPWDGGMVTPQLKKQFQSMGVQIIPREGGADTVARIVLGSSPAEILVGNWTTPTKKVGSEPVVIHRKISAASNPFLKDHVIQGRCVLPMTIAVGCLAETCLGQFPGYSLWAIEDAQLFKGVTVDGDVNCEITLKPSQGTAGRVMIQATLKTFASGKLVPAYRAVIVLSTQGKPPAATTSQTPSLQADPAARGNPYDGKTLFHGPAFQGLKEIISCNKSQLVAECTFIPSSESAGEFASDYESHNPFVNDIAFQAMLVWIRRTLGQAALPNSIQRIVQHRALPQDKPFYLTLKSNSASGHSQHKTSVQFHNEQGDLFVDIQASVTSSDSLAF
uniref:Polyketide synthase 3 n=1 Tax=Aurantiochytrium limacinum TaxID=87102 RepID=A0A3S9VMC7_9STRA|nr:polyketide synthase 3 [Aurantiochytrium limacinum]